VHESRRRVNSTIVRKVSLMNLQALWIKVKPTLLPYEGSASPLYVLDIPESYRKQAIEVFKTAVRNVNVFEQNEPPLMKGDWKGKELSFYIWPSDSNQSFDAEIVFWADQMFSNLEDKEDGLQSFGFLVNLGESLRKLSPNSICLFSASETGDPRDDLGTKWAAQW
jgi:hypothetical protein